MTVAQVITLARVFLNDEGGATTGTWLDASLIPVVDAAQAECAMLFPPECLRALQATSTLTITAATGSEPCAVVDLSTLTTMLYIRSVRLRATTTAIYFPADERRLEALFSLTRPASTLVPETSPLYATHGSTLYALPGVLTGASSASVSTIIQSTRLTATGDTLQIGEAFQRHVALQTAAIALAKIGAANEMAFFEQKFMVATRELWTRFGDSASQMPRHVAERLYPGAQTK